MKKIPTLQLVVAAALRRKDGNWLMHKRPIEKHHGGLWEFPGGKVENGENPSLALIRELDEELGITVSQADIAPVSFAHDDFGSTENPIVILLYIVRAWSGEMIPHEGGEIGWFTPEEIAQLDKPPLDMALSRNLFAQESF